MKTDLTNDAESGHHHAQDEDTLSSKFFLYPFAKKVKERIRLLVHLCAVSIRPPPRLLEPMLLIT